MQEFAQKKRPKSLFLLLAEENGSDEWRELFVRIGVGELCFPTEIEFHKTRMGLVTNDYLCVTAGLCPFVELHLFAGSTRMFVIIPFILHKEFVRSGTDFFSRERVMKMFFLGNRDVIHTLFGGFLECAGDAIDPVADSTMCHVSNGNN